MNPEARTIIDIGGQDSKVICLDGDGSIVNFIMNDKCAAGTGRFLEMMAGTLELDLKEMDALSRRWKKDLTISSTCTVFAESEVVSLIAENQDTADIIHGLNKSVASRTYAMVRRSQGSAPFMMTGGVACNPGVAEELRKFLGAPLTITEHPDLTGAVGAALSAAGII
jgi:predicted CoA-substrate-specific enzyme activase